MPVGARSSSSPTAAAAIALALAEPRPGDVVVIAGKGHETTQTIGDRRSAVRRPGRGPRSCCEGRRGDRAPHRRRRSPWRSSLFGTRFLIGFFAAAARGQPILEHEDRGPDHQHKAGTPTMGGIAILGAAVVGYLVAHLRTGVVLLRPRPVRDRAASAAMACVGFLDDWIKVRRAQPRPLWKTQGLDHARRSSFLIAVAAGARSPTIDTTLAFTRATGPGSELGNVGWVLWAGLHHLRHRQRREPHRRARRPGRRLGDLRVLRLHDHRLLGLPQPESTTSSSTPSTSPCWPPRSPAPAPGSCGGTPRRPGSSWATPARSASAPRSRCSALSHQHAAAAADHRRAASDRDRLSVALQVGSYRLLQQAPHLPHGADPPPLRAGRVARDHGHHPLLDDRRHLRRDRPRPLLRRLRPPDRRG